MTTKPRTSTPQAPKPPSASDAKRRKGPKVDHASDDTSLAGANSSDADPASRHAPLDSPRPQVTRHI